MIHVDPAPRGPGATLVAWFQRRRQASALATMDAREASRIAAELGLSVDDLMTAADQSADDIALMTRMLEAHGLSRAALEAELPDLARHMALACAKCTCKGACDHDLAAGTAKENVASYCPNTDSIAALIDR